MTPISDFHQLKLRNEVRHVAKVLELHEPWSAEDRETLGRCVALKEAKRARISARGGRECRD